MSDDRRATAAEYAPYGAVSRDTSRAIYQDALDAHADPDHPCHPFVELQREVPDGWVWQLPIPFMGRRAGRGIVFLGLNPSYGPGDDPRLGCDFETYDHYWRSWFDAHAGSWPRLYQHYQEIGASAVDSFRIGEDALVLEMIRYRSARSGDLWQLPGMFQREGGRTLALLREVAPRVVLCCGRDVLWCLRELLTSLRAQLPEHFRIGQEEGRVRRLDAGWGDVVVIGARHLTGSRPPPTRDDRRRLGEVLREALATSSQEAT